MTRIERRAIDGILLLDKPEGISSNAALQRAKRMLNARKAGHTGSLDPLATGLLPLCFGEATKISAFLLDADKRYRVTVKLGATTTTGDREGEVLQVRPVEGVDLGRVETVLARFRGDIEQVPPMYSALKHQGQRLYKLARQGVDVERPARPVTIFELNLLSWSSPELELDVRCSKGTYIRSLAEDIGEALGTGAHVTVLRRTGLGPFTGERMYRLEELEKEAPQALPDLLLPIDAALKGWPQVELSEDAAFYLCQGQAVFAPQVTAEGDVRLYRQGAGFLGIGTVLADGRVAPKRLLAQVAGS
jgi:tRNA pseudouridine55 synthase